MTRFGRTASTPVCDATSPPRRGSFATPPSKKRGGWFAKRDVALGDERTRRLDTMCPPLCHELTTRNSPRTPNTPASQPHGGTETYPPSSPAIADTRQPYAWSSHRDTLGPPRDGLRTLEPHPMFPYALRRRNRRPRTVTAPAKPHLKIRTPRWRRSLAWAALLTLVASALYFSMGDPPPPEVPRREAP